MATITLDLAGLKCPLPALHTRKALAGLAVGDQLDIICTDPMAVIDIPALAQQTGNRLTHSSHDSSGFRFSIRKESI